MVHVQSVIFQPGYQVNPKPKRLIFLDILWCWPFLWFWDILQWYARHPFLTIMLHSNFKVIMDQYQDIKDTKYAYLYISFCHDAWTCIKWFLLPGLKYIIGGVLMFLFWYYGKKQTREYLKSKHLHTFSIFKKVWRRLDFKYSININFFKWY